MDTDTIVKYFAGNEISSSDYEHISSADLKKHIKDVYKEEITAIVKEVIAGNKIAHLQKIIVERESNWDDDFADIFAVRLDITHADLEVKINPPGAESPIKIYLEFEETGKLHEDCWSEYYEGSRYDAREELGYGDYDLRVDIYALPNGSDESLHNNTSKRHSLFSISLSAFQEDDISDEKIYYSSPEITYSDIEDFDDEWLREHGIDCCIMAQSFAEYVNDKIDPGGGHNKLVMDAVVESLGNVLDNHCEAMQDDNSDDGSGSKDDNRETSFAHLFDFLNVDD